MKIKKQDLIELWQTFETLSNGEHPLKFSYFISKNKNIIKNEIEILTELSKPKQEFIEYDNKRATLAYELSDKNSAGKPIIENNSYVVTNNKEEFDSQLQILKEEYKTAIEEQIKAQKEFQAILQEDYDFDGYGIKISDLPNMITPKILDTFLKVGLILEE